VCLFGERLARADLARVNPNATRIPSRGAGPKRGTRIGLGASSKDERLPNRGDLRESKPAATARRHRVMILE